MKKPVLLVFLLFLMSACSKSSILNNKGVLEMHFEDFESAKTSFARALVLEPESHFVRYNMSLVDLSQERLKTSYDELEYLEKKIIESKTYEKKAQDLYKVLFAQAFIKTLLKDVPAALEKYQKCLDIYPDSIDVKKNIELLMNSQGGKSGPQGKNKKSKDKANENDKKSKSDSNEGGDKEDKKNKGKDESDQTPKGRDDSTLKRKKLTEKEIEQILKEIKKQEAKIRSKENTKYKGKGVNGKTW